MEKILNKRKTFKGAKFYLIKILQVLLLIGIFYVLGSANIGKINLAPFAWGLAFSMCAIWQGNLFLPFLYLIGNSLAGFNIISLYISASVFLCLFITQIICKCFKKQVKFYAFIIIGLISQIPFFIFNFTSLKDIYLTILAFILGLIFFFICYSFLKATIKRGLNLKLNLDEQICGSIILIAISVGLGKINIFDLELIKLIATLIILISTYVFNYNVTLCIGILFGVGYAITSVNPAYIALFSCYALLSLAFKVNYKLLSIFAIILGEITFGLYFEAFIDFNIFNIISVAIGGLIFLLLPTKLLNKISDYFGGEKQKIAIRNIVSRNKENICKRMKEMSEVFNEMNNVYRAMVKGTATENDSVDLIKNQLINKVCFDCPEKNKCFRINGLYTNQVFDELIKVGIKRDKVSLLDLSQYLSSRCSRVNFLINTTNSLISNFKDYSNMVTNLDTSKILIADQLLGVSEIFKQLSKEVNINFSFDLALENRIMEDLTYKNINCLEVVCYEQNIYEKNITLLIKNESINPKIIEKVVSKASNNKLSIVGISPTEMANVSSLALKTKPNYDIVFGVSSSNKTGTDKSGDSHSIIKLDVGKYMVAICDGMGSGIKAKNTSSLAISLIENFYKAGFNNDLILSSVNKMLLLNNDENFSTLDLCVLDLRKNYVDFIKLGSPSAFIKHKTGITEVENSGLPIGVLDEMLPHTTKKMLNDFDTIFLVSDGISDIFNKYDNLKNFINNLTSINPQTMADEIMSYAKNLSSGVLDDDMTVVAVRVYPI